MQSASTGAVTWPQTVDGVLPLTAAQMGYLLEAIGWTNSHLYEFTARGVG
jgi:transposase